MTDNHDVTDYKHGEMDIHQHVATYHLFNALAKWGSLIIAVALIFIVLLTCVPGTGFVTSAGVAIVVAILGWVFLKKKPDAAH